MRASAQPDGIALLLTLIFSVVLVSCGADGTQLPAPENLCKGSPASWEGIIPGQSTKSDVKQILGEPLDEEFLATSKQMYFLYSPVVTISGESHGNRVVFRNDGIVDWIDIWVSNVDGGFHTIAEVVQQHGCALDTVYKMEELPAYSVVGPVQVYVWSECGLAVSAVPQFFVQSSTDRDSSSPRIDEDGACSLAFRRLADPNASFKPSPDVSDVVLRYFIFQPTSFDSFQEYYKDQITFFTDARFYRVK